MKDRFRHLKPLHGVIAVVTVMVLVLGSASFAFAFNSGGTPAATGPDTITWTGQGAHNGVLDSTQCDAANTPYMQWNLQTDGGSASNPTLHLGGTGSGDYTAPEPSGNSFHFNTPYFTPDSSLTATVDFTVVSTGNGSWNLTISHGCSGLKPLTATKTANTSYTRDYRWDISKTVAPDSFSGDAGDPAFTSNYNVSVDQTTTDSAITVSGNIVVGNPVGNPSATFTVSDSVGGTPASVNCPTTTLAGGASTTCTYTVDLGSTTNGTNVATISSNTLGIDGTTASAAYTFGVPTNTTGFQTVNVSDSVQGVLGSTSGDNTWKYPRNFECPTDASKYLDGKYTQEFPNTATIDETKQSASANVTVNCTLPALQVEKTAAGTYNHDISWDLTKTANPTTFNGIAGQTIPAPDLWDVNATKSVVDSGYQVAGDITITNPAAIDQSFSVADVLNDPSNTVAGVDCDSATAGNQASGMVPAGGSVTCSYTASQSDKSANLNTATVIAPGNADQTDTADVLWTPTVTGDEQTTLGDARFSFSQLINSDTEQKFSDSFVCPPNDSSQYVNGKYSFDVKNTATLTGDNTNLSKDAKVTVNCEKTRVPGGLTIGFWQNKNGQDIIKGGPPTQPSTAACAVVTYLRTFAPFQDLSASSTCTQVASYVTNVIKAANASGASMNAMLKAQMLATALDVNYGKVNGGANVDLTAIPKPVTSSTYENTSAAFGGGTCQSVNALLSYASSQFGSTWYGNVKATQELAKDTFDAIDNAKAFAC